MKIKRKLNNNVAVAIDEHDNEIIVMGKGIVFQKKNGEDIDENLINKIFTLQNVEISLKFQELISDLPIKYMRVSDEIIENAKNKLGKRLSESIYISLTDHIYSAITRFSDGICLKNVLLWDIKRLYPNEFIIGMNALKIIYDNFKINFQEDEAGFIALHFMNAQLEEDMPTIYNITRMIRDITNIVQYHFNLNIDNDSLSYYRFATHLKFLSQRVINNNFQDDQTDDKMYTIISENYPEISPCLDKISNYVFDKYHTELSYSEKMYLMLHITRLIK